jgi:hypothetical protein
MEHGQDITDLLQNYRECVRHMWNIYYRSLPNINTDRMFTEVEDELFRSLVFCQLFLWQDEKICIHGAAQPYLRVAPDIAPNGTAALWAREDADGRTWHWKELTLASADIELHFMGYFDWGDKQGYRDYQKYRAEIVGYPADPSLEGAELLIDVADARVVFNNPPAPARKPTPRDRRRR